MEKSPKNGVKLCQILPPLPSAAPHDKDSVTEPSLAVGEGALHLRSSFVPGERENVA